MYKLKESTNLLDTDPTSTENTKYTKRNIWKFCGLRDIKTVEENKGTYTDQIGGDNANKNLFVPAKDSRNNWFWKIRNEEFWKKEGDGFNSKGQGKTQENNEFKKLKDNKDESWSKLRDTCETTYKTETSDGNNNKEEVYCFVLLS